MYEICHSLRSYNIAFTWEGLGAGGKGCDRGWDGWMASPTRWTWVWVNSGNWWWTGRPGVLQFIGLQRVGHNWATELNWTEIWIAVFAISFFSPLKSFACNLSQEPPGGNQDMIWLIAFKSSVQFSSVTQSCPTLCDPMNRSTPGLPVHHHLPEFTQTHVHWVRDAIQPSHPRSPPSPPAPNPSQHQSPFQWVNSSHEVAKVLELQL